MSLLSIFIIRNSYIFYRENRFLLITKWVRTDDKLNLMVDNLKLLFNDRFWLYINELVRRNHFSLVFLFSGSVLNSSENNYLALLSFFCFSSSIHNRFFLYFLHRHFISRSVYKTNISLTSFNIILFSLLFFFFAGCLLFLCHLCLLFFF